MASRLLKLFIDPEKLVRANQKYRDRMAEINKQEHEFNEALATARTNNRAAFHAQIAANKAKRDKRLASIGSK